MAAPTTNDKLILWREFWKARSEMIQYFAKIDGMPNEEIAEAVNLNTEQIESIREEQQKS